MGVALRSTTSDVANSATEIVITAPTIVEGDYLLTAIAVYRAAGVVSDFSLPGWTKRSSASDALFRTIIFAKIATAADATAGSFTWSWPETADHVNLSMAVYSGVNSVTEATPNSNSGSVSGSTFTAPGLTTVENHSRVVLYSCLSSNVFYDYLVDPSGFSSVTYVAQYTSALTRIWDQSVPSPATIGDASITVDGTFSAGAFALRGMLALNPVPGSGGSPRRLINAGQINHGLNNSGLIT